MAVVFLAHLDDESVDDGAAVMGAEVVEDVDVAVLDLHRVVEDDPSGARVAAEVRRHPLQRRG